MQARLLMPAGILALALTAAPAAAKSVRVTITDTGHTVTIDRGDTIRVALDANQTTPFHWVVTARPARAVARVTSARYVPGEQSEGMVGVGGTQRYTIRATGAGTTRFVAQYQEISTGQVGSGESRFAIRIRVR